MDHYGPRATHPAEGKSKSHPRTVTPHRSTSNTRIHNEDYVTVSDLALIQGRPMADVLCDAVEMYVKSLASAGLDEARVAVG